MTGAQGGIISIIGIDGSGKTTLAKRIVSEKIFNGRDSIYVYARFVPLLSRPIVIVAQEVLGKRSTENPSVFMVARDKKRSILRKRPIAFLQEMIFLVDYIIQLPLKINRPYRRGVLIVCDRYIEDTILTDLAPDLGWGLNTIISKIERLSRFFPKPDVTLFLSIKPEIAMRRKTDIPDIEYVRERSEKYEAFSRKTNAIIIDANRDKDIVFEEVKRAILEKLPALEGEDKAS
jgi:thymidylate kinase